MICLLFCLQERSWSHLRGGSSVGRQESEVTVVMGGGHLEDFGGRESLSAKGTDGEGVVAFGEADATLVCEEMSMEVGGRRKH